jgi:superfamily II DNA or RNA helicase
MKLKWLSPVYIEIIDPSNEELRSLEKLLTFKDNKVKYEIDRFKHSYWFVSKYGEEAYAEKLEELRSKEQKSLLITKNGKLVTYSGLINLIASIIKVVIPPNPFCFEKVSLPWAKQPPELRYYQQQAIDKLIEVKHGAISLPTGSGKSLALLYLTKHFGVKTVIMTPSVSIGNQLYETFKEHLGAKYLGKYGDGKKEFKKLITIATGQSLTRIEDDTAAYEAFSNVKLFCSDESHTTPAETFEKVCSGPLESAPLRYFFSATQMRNDGSDLLLEGIIGPVVYEKTTDDLINEGFLAKPHFMIMSAFSSSDYTNKDAMRMISKHLYNNVELHKTVATFSNASVASGKKVMIMIDQVTQFKYLYPHLKGVVAFAHGGKVSKENMADIPEKFHKSDADELVADFNNGKIDVLIGTSCISVGTDIKPVNIIYNLQGGKSEVKFKQLIGRGTRLSPGKKDFWFVDFDIKNIPMIHNQSLARIAIYKSFYDNIVFK